VREWIGELVQVKMVLRFCLEEKGCLCGYVLVGDDF